MSTLYEIPLATDAQKFSIVLAGQTYNLSLYWNGAAMSWGMDIADQIGNPILQGVPLVTGADLLAQYEYLDFAGGLLVYSDAGADVIPDYASFGSTAHLYFVTTP